MCRNRLLPVVVWVRFIGDGTLGRCLGPDTLEASFFPTGCRSAGSALTRMPYTWRGPYPLRRVSCITRVSVSKLPKGPGPGRLSSVSLLGLYDPRMKRLFLVVVAVAVLAVSACGGDAEPQPPATQPSQPEVIEPATTAAVAVSTTAGEPSPLRAEAELAVAARLAADAPGSVTDEQIACVASATVEALDEERLSVIVAALDEPSAAMLPAGIISGLERHRIVDAAAGCLPWTQTILDSLQDLPDVPAAVVECAQAAAPSVETDRLAADIALFSGEFVTVLNLVLPPGCLPQTGGSQADTMAGRLTATQLVLEGVSPESAACVAEQVDALGGMPSGESDTDESDTEAAMAAEQAIVAMMLGCLTPEEMALLSGPGSP